MKVKTQNLKNTSLRQNCKYAYMEVGGRTTQDAYMDIGGRVTQEQLPSSYRRQSRTILKVCFIHGLNCVTQEGWSNNEAISLSKKYVIARYEAIYLKDGTQVVIANEVKQSILRMAPDRHCERSEAISLDNGSEFNKIAASKNDSQ